MFSKLRSRYGLAGPLALVALVAIAGVPAIAQPVANTSASIFKLVKRNSKVGQIANKRSVAANKRSVNAIKLARNANGQEGPRGPQGEKGDKGDKGDRGPRGEPAPVGDFWRQGGNSGTNPAADYLGTSDDTAFELGVNGITAMILEPATDGGDNPAPNVIGGSPENQVTPGVSGATISGGGLAPPAYFSANSVTGDLGAVGGGSGNQAGPSAAVGGGLENTATEGNAVVGGGIANNAHGNSAAIAGGASNEAGGSYATVSGGADNVATNAWSTVAGGQDNLASGLGATVGGGADNTAAGAYSFVVGRHAKNEDPAHDGVFLFADGSVADFDSVAEDEFAVRAHGGVRFVTDTFPTTGCSIDPGGGAWDCTSDVRTKRDFEDVDPQWVLDRLVELPVRSWRYKAEDTSVRHLGPTAQGFHRAFGLGESRTSIGLLDASGVALAAIKGLHEENLELKRRVKSEHRSRLRLTRKLAEIETRLERIGG